jgi:protein-tyrosine kinase
MTIAAQTTPKGIHHDRNSSMNADDVHSTLDQDRSIGDIIRETKSMTQDQVNQILEYQRANNLRFGESAVKLGLVSDSDIVFALSQQFNYPYAPESRRANHRELVAAAQPFGKQAEAFRAIRSQLMMRIFSPQEPKRALAVTSPEGGDGKTFLVANLGVVLAQLGGRTLIVDANLRNPRLHELFDLPNTSGLTGILSGRQEENVIYQAPDIPSLFVMPVGVIPPNPLELLERPAFRLLMSELLRKFDHVVVDTPASSLGSDALVIAARSGAAMTLARKNKTRVKQLHDLVGQLSETTAKLTGVIVNEF